MGFYTKMGIALLRTGSGRVKQPPMLGNGQAQIWCTYHALVVHALDTHSKDDNKGLEVAENHYSRFTCQQQVACGRDNANRRVNSACFPRLFKTCRTLSYSDYLVPSLFGKVPFLLDYSVSLLLREKKITTLRFCFFMDVPVRMNS
jgi:hypothetical protein